jgi:NAD dependent epimerase/dehydratase family enzyme
MKVAVTGASGLVGSALVPFLSRSGHEVVRLVRSGPRAEDQVRWDPARGEIDAAGLEAVEGVVHLSGENLAGGRWTAARKARLVDSRWVAIDDVLGALHHALAADGLHGAFNLVAPEPVTNREFTKALGHVLGRPTLIPVPAFALRMALGEMADATLLASTRVRPRRLEDTEYDFRFPTLEGALCHVLGRADL